MRSRDTPGALPSNAHLLHRLRCQLWRRRKTAGCGRLSAGADWTSGRRWPADVGHASTGKTPPGRTWNCFTSGTCSTRDMARSAGVNSIGRRRRSRAPGRHSTLARGYGINSAANEPHHRSGAVWHKRRHEAAVTRHATAAGLSAAAVCGRDQSPGGHMARTLRGATSTCASSHHATLDEQRRNPAGHCQRHDAHVNHPLYITYPTPCMLPH